MLQHAPNCTSSRRSMPPNPPKKRLATPHVASCLAAYNSSSPPKSWVLPLANPAYAHGLLLRNLFEKMRS